MEVLTKIKVRVETQQPKELKVFDSLRLSMVVAVEIFAEILAEILAEVAANIIADVTADIATDVIADVSNRTELKA